MADSKILRFKVATKKLMTATSWYFRELSGTYRYHGNKFVCPVCNTNLAYFDHIDFEYLRNFEDHAFVHNIFQLETSNLTDFSCPKCRATDRDRLYALYIRKIIGGDSRKEPLNLVDFAPQHGLSRMLKTSNKIKYRSADLYMEGVDDKVDITDMKQYADNTFDVFVCSHVLEHIEDDGQAIRELYRILKPGGWGIAMVPIMLTLESTYKDASVQTDGDRWKYYMQNDHVRMYSRDGFTDALKSGGFDVQQYDAAYFGKETFKKHGIQARSVLHIVNKR